MPFCCVQGFSERVVCAILRRFCPNFQAGPIVIADSNHTVTVQSGLNPR